MLDYHLVPIPELNALIRDRGLEIVEVFHPEPEYHKFIPKCTYRISLKEEYEPSGEVSMFEVGWNSLNRIFDQRGVVWTQLDCSERELFANFTGDFTMKLRFTIRVKGEWQRKKDGWLDVRGAKRWRRVLADGRR